MTIAMLSLAGVPATAGFIGKFYLIDAAVAGDYAWLGIVIVVGSVVSLAYYLRVIAVMWMGGYEVELPTCPPRARQAGVGLVARGRPARPARGGRHRDPVRGGDDLLRPLARPAVRRGRATWARLDLSGLALDALRIAPTRAALQRGRVTLRDERMSENLARILTDTAAEHGDRTAFKLDDVELTYAALDEASARVAALLEAKGVEPGDRVGPDAARTSPTSPRSTTGSCAPAPWWSR